jgi:hypothetical protein
MPFRDLQPYVSSQFVQKPPGTITLLEFKGGRLDLLSEDSGSNPFISSKYQMCFVMFCFHGCCSFEFYVHHSICLDAQLDIETELEMHFFIEQS